LKCLSAFGQRSGISGPGETAGSLSSYKAWSAIDAGAISFGQGISVSAIQLISAASAIANDGMLMKPTAGQVDYGPQRTDGQTLFTRAGAGG
jgi:cell division protein FtsI/penicillin-binding protein 2